MSTKPTRFELEFAADAQKAPADVREKARRFFEQLLADLAVIPDENAFWDSMQVSILAHAEGGWSFLYRFDGRKLLVYDVRRD